jgi:serine/threonine protein kinase
MEEWVGRRLSNRHLIKTLRKPAEPRFLFHAMEYVEGRSLRDWIRCNAKPSVNEVVDIVEGIIAGLRAMHRKETLHGDLKPDNIMIGSDGIVRIIDFGSCHVAGVREIDLPFSRGLALGTERYSAPECHLGRPPSPRSDLFSLAMIAYEMLTHGQRPFGEKFERASSPRDFSALSYAPAARHNPLVTSWIDGALRRALSTDPDSRQPCLSEFLTDLKRPNPSYVSPADAPLLARNALAFWKGLCGFLALLVVVLLVVLLGG